MRAQEVADWVRDRVRLGKLVPGQRLIEADIVRDTGASRGRVREALRRLESEGLVAIEEFRGASVKRLGADEVRQIYRARMVLEGLAAAEFAAADDTPRKQRLLALQAQMDENETAANHDRFARLNSAWHRLIIEGADNAYVAQFLASLTVPIYRLLFSTFYAAHRIRMANADHRIITAAIAAGRAEEAERAMRAHIAHGLVALTELNSHFEQ
ncbi:MAG TPA: GntR family transcriptional regulator [Steroidobacteraceae bacterium]|nr:GntR family transcriptional regulator [Steroidobacteraceae bacterium]